MAVLRASPAMGASAVVFTCRSVSGGWVGGGRGGVAFWWLSSLSSLQVGNCDSPTPTLLSIVPVRSPTPFCSSPALPLSPLLFPNLPGRQHHLLGRIRPPVPKHPSRQPAHPIPFIPLPLAPHTRQVGSIDSLDQYDPRVALASGSSVDRLQSLLDASHHSSDGSSHGPGRGGGSSGGSAGRGLFAAGAAAAAPVAPLQDYKDKSWNKPPPNFRFDFGGGFDGGAAEGDGAAHHQGQGAGAEEPKGTGEEAPARAWPGLTTGSPELGVQLPPPQLRPMQLPANGAVRGGGHFDKRMHGASLYRNQLLAPNHHPAAAGLAPVKE